MAQDDGRSLPAAGLLASVRLRLLGLGFVWAWVYGAFSTDALYHDRLGASINSDEMWVVSAALVVVSLFLFGWLLRETSLRSRRVVQLGAGILCAMGTAMSVIPAGGGLSVALTIVSGVITGAGSALLILMWCECLSLVSMPCAEASICLYPLVPLVCSVVLSYVDGVLGIVAVSLLPVASSVMLMLSFSQVVADRTDLGEHALGGAGGSGVRTLYASAETRVGFARSMVAVICVYVAMGFLAATRPATDVIQSLVGVDLATLLGSLAGILFVVVFVNLTMRIDFTELFRWVTPIAVLVLALSALPGAGAQLACGVLSDLVDVSVQAVSYLCLVALAKRGIARIYPAAGVCQGCLQFGVLVGNLAGQSLGIASDGILWLACLLCLANALLPRPSYEARPSGGGARATRPATFSAPGPAGDARASADTRVLEDERVTEDARICGDAQAEVQAQTEAQPLSDALDALDARCQELAALGGLSRREAQVLGYLARGRSQPYIREELVLSKNTVSSHVKHIYAKLDVHSRQELLDLVHQG